MTIYYRIIQLVRRNIAVVTAVLCTCIVKIMVLSVSSYHIKESIASLSSFLYVTNDSPSKELTSFSYCFDANNVKLKNF